MRSFAMINIKANDYFPNHAYAYAVKGCTLNASLLNPKYLQCNILETFSAALPLSGSPVSPRQ